MARATFELSLESQLLIDRLKKAAIGEIITTAELSATIHGPIAKHYGALVTARRHCLLLESGPMFFVTLRSEGIKRATDEEANAQLAQDLHGIHRRAGRVLKRQGKITYESLTPDGKRLFATVGAVLHVVSMATSTSGLCKVEKAIESAKKDRLNLEETIRVFANGNK